MRKFWWQGALIVLVVWTIFWPVLHGGFLMDDDYYIKNNPVLRDPWGPISIWLSLGSLIEYYPIESTLQWAQWQLWGDDTLGYHVTNIFLHCISALLVWRVLSKLGLRFAWLGGLLFAVHPMTVESVAWMAEFKNTLSLPPFLVCLCFWIDFENNRVKSPRRSEVDYAWALAWFVIAMFCKITMLLFPVIILLYAWWKRGRITWKDLKIASPFAAISAILLVVTIVAGQIYSPGKALAVVVPLHSVFDRIVVSGLDLAFYLWKCVLPIGMLPLYPHWHIDPPSVRQLLPWPIFVGGAYWLWSQRRYPWARHLLLGLGYFFINLSPFVGFRDISFMRFTWVMDHFVYLPLIGVIGLLMAGLDMLDKQIPTHLRRYGAGLAAVVILALAVETHSYAGRFINQETLWTYELQHDSESWVAENDLAAIMFGKGQLSQAEGHLRRAIVLYPTYSEAHNNLGLVFLETGRIDQARTEFETALTITPDYPDAQAHLDIANEAAARAAAGRKPPAPGL